MAGGIFIPEIKHLGLGAFFMSKHDKTLKDAWPATLMQTDYRVTPSKRKGEQICSRILDVSCL